PGGAGVTAACTGAATPARSLRGTSTKGRPPRWPRLWPPRGRAVPWWQWGPGAGTGMPWTRGCPGAAAGPIRAGTCPKAPGWPVWVLLKGRRPGRTRWPSCPAAPSGGWRPCPRGPPGAMQPLGRDAPPMAKAPTDGHGHTGHIIIEPMKMSDLKQVLAIENLSFPAPWSRQSFISDLSYNRAAIYLVARQDDQIIGYAGMWVVVDEAHITNIAVHPAWRRLGVGRRLMDRLVEIAQANRCRAITLEVRKSNLAAQNLYTQYGFTAQG